MTEHEQIRRLMADYCHLVDDGLHERWVQLYAPDAEVVMGRRTYSGHEEILGWIRMVAEAAPEPNRHHINNLAIDVQGEAATVRSDWLVVGASLSVAATGRYDDELVRTPDGWRIARRVISMLRA